MKHRKLKPLSYYMNKDSFYIELNDKKHQARMNELTDKINRTKNQIKGN